MIHRRSLLAMPLLGRSQAARAGELLFPLLDLSSRPRGAPLAGGGALSITPRDLVAAR